MVLSFTGIIRVLIILASFFGALSSIYPDTHHSQSIHLTNGWQYHWGKLSTTNAKVSLPYYQKETNWSLTSTLVNPPGKSTNNWLWLKIKLPAIKAPDTVLHLHSVDTYFEAYIDDTFIYQHGNRDINLGGFSWHMIPMPNSYSGKTLYLRIFSKIHTIGINAAASLGPQSVILSNILKKDLDKSILGFVFICLGAIALFISYTRIEQKAFISFALFAVAIGLYTIARTELKQVILGENYIFWGYLELLSLYFTPFGINIFYIEMIKTSKNKSPLSIYAIRLLYILAYFSLIYTGITGIISMFFPNILLTVLPFFQNYLLLNILTLITIAVIYSFKGNQEARIVTFGLIILTLFAFHGLFQEMRIIPKTGFVTQWGLFIFILCLVNIIGRRLLMIHNALKTTTRQLEQDKVFMKRAHQEQILLNQEIDNTQKEIIYRLSEVAEARSKETGNHVIRVAKYSTIIAEELGLSNKEVDILKLAAPMHDIGKLGIPDSILNKPGKLTATEFEKIKAHTIIGYEMMNKSKREIFSAASIVAFQHHEKFDGSGYPQGIKSGNIHIFGRIVAVADVFDSLASDRIYKKAWSMDRVLEFMQDQKEKHFDPDLIDILLHHIEDFLEIKNQFNDDFNNLLDDYFSIGVK